MFNRVIFLGNLTRDCELAYLPNGGAVTKTGIASTRKFKKQDGTQAEEVCFVDLTFFGRSAEVANKYLKSGSKCLVEGRLKLDQWTDQQGVKRSKHSITVETMQMLDSRQQSEENAPKQPKVETYSAQGQKTGEFDYSGVPDIDIDPEQIPF